MGDGFELGKHPDALFECSARPSSIQTSGRAHKQRLGNERMMGREKHSGRKTQSRGPFHNLRCGSLWIRTVKSTTILIKCSPIAAFKYSRSLFTFVGNDIDDGQKI